MNEQLKAISQSARLFFGNDAVIEACERGNVNTSCYINHHGGRYFIKTETRADMPDFYSGQIERDIEGNRLLKENGLPCAETLFSGMNSLNQSYMISTAVQGRMVSEIWPYSTDEEKQRIRDGIVEIVNALGKIHSPCFGSICPGSKIGRYASWKEACTSLISIALSDCLNFGSLNRDEAKTIQSAADMNAELFAYKAPPSFCHMDIHWYNVMADNGKITGLLDFGCALYAPSYSDIFRLDGAFTRGNGRFFSHPPLKLNRHENFSADLLNTLDYYVFLSMKNNTAGARERLVQMCRDYLKVIGNNIHLPKE